MPSSKFGSKFLGEERYQQYVNELTAEGTVGGEQLSPEERKEGFKKRNDKIGFQNFVDKVLKKKQKDGSTKEVPLHFNNTVFVFTMKNRFGWRDKWDLEIGGKPGQPVQ